MTESQWLDCDNLSHLWWFIRYRSNKRRRASTPLLAAVKSGICSRTLLADARWRSASDTRISGRPATN